MPPWSSSFVLYLSLPRTRDWNVLGSQSLASRSKYISTVFRFLSPYVWYIYRRHYSPDGMIPRNKTARKNAASDTGQDSSGDQRTHTPLIVCNRSFRETVLRMSSSRSPIFYAFGSNLFLFSLIRYQRHYTGARTTTPTPPRSFFLSTSPALA